MQQESARRQPCATNLEEHLLGLFRHLAFLPLRRSQLDFELVALHGEVGAADWDLFIGIGVIRRPLRRRAARGLRVRGDARPARTRGRKYRKVLGGGGEEERNCSAER